MKRIHHIVIHLEPAIRHDFRTVVERGPITADVRPQFFIRSKILEHVIAWQDRCPFWMTHVGKHHSISLLDRIPWLARHLPVAAATWFARLKQTSSFHIEFPAVVVARDSLLGDLSVEERRAPVHTAWIQQ